MANVYIISSSPPARHLSIYDMPSSPPLPSLGELLNKEPQTLRTGSCGSPSYQNATATFTSAATLSQNAPSKNLDVDTIAKTAKPRGRKVAAKKVDNGDMAARTRNVDMKNDDAVERKKVANARKSATRNDDTIEGETEVKKPRKSRAKKADSDEQGPVVAKAPVQRKSRAKKTNKETVESETLVEKPVRKAKTRNTESQTKLPKGRITKASTAVPPKTTASKIVPDPLEDYMGYGLLEASKRRAAWTPPPKPRRYDSTTPVDVGLLDGCASFGSQFSGERSKGFSELLGNYGFTKADSNTAQTIATVQGTRKRKLIELVKTSVATAAAASPEKAPKKKPRTLTDLATSAYAEEEVLPPADPAPLLQYFPLLTTERTTADGFKIPPKPRSKSPVKGGTKAKKGTVQAPILLSPESAMKQVGKQEFVFGTSSQLAREDSPTLLRDLHEAMQASNEADDDPFADILIESASQTLHLRVKSSVSTKRNLWSAASRDGEGELNIEMVDLVNTPVATKTVGTDAILDPPASLLDDNDEDFWHDVEELSQSLTQKSLPVEALSRTGVGDDTNPKSLSSPAKTVRLEAASQKSTSIIPTQHIKASQISSKTGKESVKAQDLAKPDFDSYTTAQLAKEIASYRFKAIKSRDQMILLLEKCWEGKNRTALATLGTNTAPVPWAESSKPAAKSAAPKQSQSSTSPKRPRGRPRKDSTTTSPAKLATKTARKKALNTVQYLDMDSDTPLSQIRTPKKSWKHAKEPTEDIIDSEPIHTPSPPRRKISPKKTKALTLKFSSSFSDSSLELSPTSSQRLLFKHISSAVTDAPPAKDSSNPSWHEKILLYDPIIVEDLTVWLNTGALGKVGWDGEVDPKEVKKWCESRSICCLWKENLRGGSRSRY